MTHNPGFQSMNEDHSQVIVPVCYFGFYRKLTFYAICIVSIQNFIYIYIYIYTVFSLLLITLFSNLEKRLESLC